MTGLDPTGDDARSLLRRELVRPEYNQENPVLRLLDWIAARLDDGLSRASQVQPLVVVAAVVVLFALAVAVIWLVGRARSDRSLVRTGEGVLDDVRVSAAELRRRAEDALATGHHEEALLEAFRALAMRQVEAGRLQDLPGATAREIAATLAGDHPARESEARRAAYLFDGVRYGERRVEAAQVVDVLRLDDELAGVR